MEKERHVEVEHHQQGDEERELRARIERKTCYSSDTDRVLREQLQKRTVSEEARQDVDNPRQ